MKVRNEAILLHPIFIGSLFLLLLNDIALKYEFPNWFTGKLSDFTGLFALSVFVMIFFRTRSSRIAVNVIIALIFTWWKSSLSQSAIDLFNDSRIFTIARVVDYSDLAALVILPVAILFVERIKTSNQKTQPILIRLMCLIALFSFCQTSMPRHLRYYRQDRINYLEQFKTDKSQEQILDLFTAQGSSWRIDSVFYYPLSDEELYHRNPDSTWHPIMNSKDSLIYVKKRAYENFYLIDFHVISPGDTIRDIEVGFLNHKKKLRVEIRSFKSPSGSRYLLPEKMKKYKKHFKNLF